MTAGALRASVFLLLLTLFLFAANLVFTVREIHAATAAAASVVQLCQLGNSSRAQQVILWDHVITISQPPPGETPAQRRQRRARVRAFLAYVHHVFAPRNCTGRFQLSRRLALILRPPR